MSTQQTPNRTGRPAPKRIDTDPVPKNLRWLRALLTILAIVLLIGGAGWAAFAFGNGSSRIPPAGAIVAGFVLFVLAPRPALYLAVAASRAKTAAAKAQHATAVTDTPMPDKRPANTPRPRGRRGRPDPETPASAPAIDPAHTLGEDFRFIVINGRRMRRDLAEAMNERYAELMKDVDGDYFQAVDLVRSIAQEHDYYAEEGEDGYVDPRNPGLFLTELDAINGTAAAVAAALLVKGDDDVTEDTFNAVMAPWIEQRLPFLYNGVKYISDGTKVTKAPAPKPRTAAAPATPVAYAAPTPARDGVDVDLTDEVAATRPPTAADAPAPAPAAAATPPAAVTVTVDDLALAAELVITSQHGSIPMIQRKMRIGFAHASAVFDKLAELGIVRRLAADSSGIHASVLEPADNAADTVAWIRENVQ